MGRPLDAATIAAITAMNGSASSPKKSAKRTSRKRSSRSTRRFVDVPASDSKRATNDSEGWSCIMNPYGYASAGCVLRGDREEELFTSGREARWHAARRQPADTGTREAPERAARRPLGPPG